MNRRQAKKAYMKQFLMCKTYSATRAEIRHQHFMSIDKARKEHRNYWEGWNRGYPNRYRIKQWFNAPRQKVKTFNLSELEW